MFNKELFSYVPEEHEGYYKGKLVPSVTQLIDVLYPYGEDVPKERLDNAAQRGTKIHGRIEMINDCYDNSNSFMTNIDKLVSIAALTETTEVFDYVSMLSVYGLKPNEWEDLIFLCDEKGDLICYGHYDCVFTATKDIACFNENKLYMADFKTTSLFDKNKVALQLSVYAAAYEQCNNKQIEDIFGVWLREGLKIIPLELRDSQTTIELCKQLKLLWEE